MHSSIKVLLADDHQIVAEGIQSLLQEMEGIEVIKKCSNGKQVIDFLKENRVDLVLMDIDMPVLSGIQAAKIIQRDFPDVHIIALSMHNKMSYVKKMLQNGAKGYLLKTTNKEELFNAIRSVVVKKTQFISPNLKKEILDDLFNLENKSKLSTPVLTKREKEVLKLISEEYTNIEIAKTLFISTNTVEFHRKNLLTKFDVRNSIGLVKKALVEGII